MDLLKLRESIRTRNEGALLKRNPQLTNTIRQKIEAELGVDELKKTNAEQAKRIDEYVKQSAELTEKVAELEKAVAERDARIKALQADVDTLSAQLEQAAQDTVPAAAPAKKRSRAKAKA